MNQQGRTVLNPEAEAVVRTEMAKPLRDIVDQVHLTRAESLLQQGRLWSAARHLVRVRGTGRHTSRAWRLKGRLLYLAGLPLAAVECLYAATRHSGATLGCVLELGYCLAHARDFERAEGIFRSYLERRPTDRVAATLLAHVYRAQGRFETALDILRSFRPKNVAGKYADLIPPPPKIAWRPERAWADALAAFGKAEDHWCDPAAMANDRDLRDDLLCFFDDLDRRHGWKKALAHGVALAIESDQGWLMPWVRRAQSCLKLQIPRALPMFVARHGGVEDKALLLAGLASGGRQRVLSAAALISLGFPEYEEVLLEMRGSKKPATVPTEVWTAADALLRLQSSP